MVARGARTTTTRAAAAAVPTSRVRVRSGLAHPHPSHLTASPEPYPYAGGTDYNKEYYEGDASKAEDQDEGQARTAQQLMLGPVSNPIPMPNPMPNPTPTPIPNPTPDPNSNPKPKPNPNQEEQWRPQRVASRRVSVVHVGSHDAAGLWGALEVSEPEP